MASRGPETSKEGAATDRRLHICRMPTCLGACEDAMVLGSHHLHSFLAVDGSVGQDHGRVVLIHEVPCDGADQLAVHMLGPGQLLC